MNSVALTGQRNFPITTDALAFMQGAYGMLENFSKLAGDNYILSGCTVTGASVSSGMVVIGGRLMPFAGGSIQENAKVVTTITTITVGAGSREQTSYAAEFGTSTNPAENIAWGTLSANRIDNMITLKAGLAALNNGVNEITEDLTTRLDNKQTQLDILNRAIVLCVASIGVLGNVTVKMAQPGLTFSGEVMSGPAFLRVNHNIGHTNYFVIPTGSSALGSSVTSAITGQEANNFYIWSRLIADGSIDVIDVDFMIIAYSA